MKDEKALLFYEKMRDKHSEMIKKHTIQIFLFIDENNIKPHGSGVLLKFNSKFYIWSAAHVLEKKYREQLCVISGQQEIMFIGNRVKCTSHSNWSHIDMGIIELTQNQADDLSIHYQFLENSAVKVNHQAIEGEFYSVVGFPETKTKLKYKSDILNRGILSHKTSVVMDKMTYSKLKTSSNTNILINYSKCIYYEKKEVVGSATVPYGISGCGLWYHDIEGITISEHGIEFPYYLIGIMIEWPPEDRTKLKATKIDPFHYNCMELNA